MALELIRELNEKWTTRIYILVVTSACSIHHRVQVNPGPTQGSWRPRIEFISPPPSVSKMNTAH